MITAFLAGCVVETSGPEPAPVDPAQALERRVSLARQYIGAGDWENAKRNLELAAAIDAENADVLEAFALVYQSTGEFELAESNFKEALDAGAGRAAKGAVVREGGSRRGGGLCDVQPGVDPSLGRGGGRRRRRRRPV